MNFFWNSGANQQVDHGAPPVDVGAPAGPVPIAVSVGIAAFHAGEDSVDTLVDRADRMLYRAKDRGRNRVEIDR